MFLFAGAVKLGVNLLDLLLYIYKNNKNIVNVIHYN